MAKKSKKRKKQQRRHHFVTQTGQTPASQPVKNQSTTPAESAAAVEPNDTVNAKASSEAGSVETASVRPTTVSAQPAPVDQQLAERIRYMKQDSRLTALIAGSIMVGLIILWILFDHTGLGPHIYKLVNFS